MSTAVQPSLFDANGRLIPLSGEMVYSQVDRRYFRLLQPSLDWSAIHSRATRHLDVPVDLDAFQARCEALKAAVLADPAARGLFDGVHVPFLLPAAPADAELGGELEGPVLGALGASFGTTYPDYEFRNHVDHGLAGQVAVVPGVRYERLLAARAKGPVVGWWFPAAMAGFAIPQQREVVTRLPEAMILAGPLEAACAMVGSPAVLHNDDHYPNGLSLSAVTPPNEDDFYFFEAYGWNLTFNQRSMLGAVSEYFSGGVTIIDAP